MKSKLRKQIKKGRKRGESAEKILNTLLEVASSTGDVIEAILTSPYGSSYSRLSKRTAEIEREREWRAEKLEKERQFRNLLYRLQRDGLIQKEPRKGILWQLTSKGKNELRDLQKHRKKYPSYNNYPEVDEGEMKIIAFDIPERYKFKRKWLRGVLKAFEFRMIQKSVWVGKAKLPKEFLEDLNKLDLIPCVEIFATTKAGSLEKLYI